MSAKFEARGDIRVWDLFVRIFHWSAVVLFFVAYFTEDDLLRPHVWSGYVLGVLIGLRMLWGVVGPRHARFSDFIYGPAQVLAYLRDLLRFSAQRYLGHSPAGGAMVLALLFGLAVTIGSGLLLHGANGKGPLAPLMAASAPAASLVPVALADDDDEYEREKEGRGGDESPFAEAMEDLHELAADLTLFLVVLHVAGVILASFVHRENLARAMVTGRKRADGA